MTYFDLGCHTRPISTRSAEAQRWFDLGLNWRFGFNHEEGVACFENALAADPHHLVDTDRYRDAVGIVGGALGRYARAHHVLSLRPGGTRV